MEDNAVEEQESVQIQSTKPEIRNKSKFVNGQWKKQGREERVYRFLTGS